MSDPTWVHADVGKISQTKDFDMPSRPFAEHRDTPLWSVIEESVNELMLTGEVSVNTAADYVVGYLCQELVARKLIATTGAER